MPTKSKFDLEEPLSQIEVAKEVEEYKKTTEKTAIESLKACEHPQSNSLAKLHNRISPWQRTLFNNKDGFKEERTMPLIKMKLVPVQKGKNDLFIKKNKRALQALVRSKAEL